LVYPHVVLGQDPRILDYETSVAKCLFSYTMRESCSVLDMRFMARNMPTCSDTCDQNTVEVRPFNDDKVGGHYHGDLAWRVTVGTVVTPGICH